MQHLLKMKKRLKVQVQELIAPDLPDLENPSARDWFSKYRQSSEHAVKSKQLASLMNKLDQLDQIVIYF